MMVIYIPVKYEFDWTNCFLVGVRKRKCGQTDGWTEKWTKNRQTDRKTDKQTGLQQFRKEPGYDGDLYPCQV